MVVLHDIVHVLLVEAVRPQKLVHDVHPVALFHERRLYGAALFDPLGLRQGRVAVHRAHLRGQVGQHEQRRVLRADFLASLVRQRHFARALVDREIEPSLQFVRVVAAHLGEHLHLAVLVDLADFRILKEVQELLVLRHGVVHHVEAVAHLVQILRLPRFLRLLHEFVALRRLHPHDGVHQRTQLLVHVARGHRRRTRNDQRRARLVDEDGVHFVHDREIVSVLHDLGRLLRHAVVAQVVEAEFAVRAVGYVAGVLRAAFGGVHRILDAPDRQAEVPVQVTHPCRVALGQVVVHRHELDVFARQRVQVERQGRHQRLAFARLHLGDLALVQDDAAQKLHVERHHVPRQRVAADFLRRADQVPARVLHERERLRQEIVQRLAFRNPFTERRGHLGEVFVGKVLLLIFFLDAVDLTHHGPQFLELAFVLRSKQYFQQVHMTTIIP